MPNINDRLNELGITLPVAPKPVAAYVPAVQTGSLVFVSGQVPISDGVLSSAGPVPSAVDLDAAIAAARLCGLNALAVLSAHLDGDLNRVRRIVRLGVFVASDATFHDQPKVANGASELMQDVFGDAGLHVRAAVGSVSLPLGATVEVELVAEVAGS
ncbi:MAG: RidA family protein [Phycisphaerales bacterium]|nr:RidA family protein [Phycisphaerales bacterium]